MNETYLLCLRVWHHGGYVHYGEHTGDLAMAERIAASGVKRDGAYQSRCTAYQFGSGSVVDAVSFGSVFTGWRYGNSVCSRTSGDGSLRYPCPIHPCEA